MKDKNNNQLPPHLYDYWVRDTLKDGAIIKKKLMNKIKIQIIINMEETTKTSKKNDDDDRKHNICIINIIRRYLSIYKSYIKSAMRILYV